MYTTKRAARYAFRFPDEVLQELQDEVNKNESMRKRAISFEMLRMARKRKRRT